MTAPRKRKFTGAVVDLSKVPAARIEEGKTYLLGPLPTRTRRITKLRMQIPAFDPKIRPGERKPDLEYVEDGMDCGASWHLFLIREAWDGGCDFEDLADGFGPGCGTGPDQDWSGIRDSSPEAKILMVQRALNFVRTMMGWLPAGAVRDFNDREHAS